LASAPPVIEGECNRHPNAGQYPRRGDETLDAIAQRIGDGGTREQLFTLHRRFAHIRRAKRQGA
jgi:hypothetical protein